ncbi:MAG: hypothetical protein MUF48_22260 [Pirellulaceae bacterium]|nr:hypothetical protein [Pirellulaceae bacterium]
MRPDDVIELVRRQPFTPFRIHVTGGQQYDIHHPDQVIVLRSRIVLPAATDGAIPERLDHIAHLHVVRLEELPNNPPVSSG